MKLNMDEARRLEARDRCEAVYPDWVEMKDAVYKKPAFMEPAPGITICSPHNTEPIARFSGYLMPLEANVSFAIHARTDLPEALDDIDTLLARLKRLLVAAENHARVHQWSSAMPLLLNFEMEQTRKLLDEANE